MSDLREARDEYVAAADWAAEVVDAVPASAWNGAGLGAWDLRGLVGHTSRSFVTVLEHADWPATDVEIESAADYYALTAPISEGGGDAVTQRGVAAGERLGGDPATAFRDLRARAVASIPAGGEPLIKTLVGGMRLRDYLHTRTFELTVHSLDIAHAIGLAGEPPAAPLRRSLELATSLAARSGNGGSVLLALTGRRALPAGFSALG